MASEKVTTEAKKSLLRGARADYSRCLIEASLDPLVTIAADGKIMDVNASTEAITGVARDRLIGSDFADYFTDPEQAHAGFREVFGQGTVANYPLAIRHVSGKVTEVLYDASIFHGANGEVAGLVAAARDVTELKWAEAALRRTNRELRAISDCNQTLVRAVDEQTLLNDICRIVCDNAGYRMAWVGYAENDDAKTIRPVAWAGVEDGYIEQANLTWADTEQGHRPGGVAIRGGESACIEDFAADPEAAPWRDGALQRGYRSCVALPLKDGVNAFGFLALYSSEPNVFTAAELRLLEELSGDLAFGIVTLRARAEHKRAEESLRQSEEKFRSLVHNIPDVVWTTDQDGKTTFLSDNVGGILGYAAAEVYGMRDFWFRNVHPDDAARVSEAFSLLMTDGRQYDVEYRFQRKDGEWIWLHDRATLTYEKDHVRYADGIFSDVTELKAYQSELERKTNYDDLTGLPNRNLLTDRLTQAVARCRRERTKLAVLVLNLDRFGELNDSLGRAVGDSVLRETAERLRQLVRGTDTLARSGGDEFVLVGEVGEEDEPAHLARRVLEALAQPFRLADRELFFYAGVGISVLPKDGEDGEILLNNAQVAMYRTKASGGNKYLFYSAEMNAHSLEHLNLENDLRRALERDEFLLHYQPQVSLRNGALVGIEALVRWRHPLRGLVSPMEFIPLAEATGLIVPLGEWVLRTACAQNQAWRSAGLHTVAVAVNLSARQFEVQDIVALTGKI
ncbi:MAG: diguanylate cyclase, partial [Sterolibacterium sp.]